MPIIAKQMKHLSIIRSYTSRDGSHERGTYINHTAFAPVASVKHPAIGAVMAKFNTPDNLEIPGHISLGGPGVSPKFGSGNAPFQSNPEQSDSNSSSAVNHQRFERRIGLLETMQDSLVKQGRGELPKEHHTIYDRSLTLMSSKLLESFKIDKVPAAKREKSGDHQFGRNCLLATRLVEIGVPFIEIGLGGWDMHQEVFESLGTSRNARLPQLDQGFGSLVEDLAATGMLEKTTICCMGDFGRTPKINQDAGAMIGPPVGRWSSGVVESKEARSSENSMTTASRSSTTPSILQSLRHTIPGGRNSPRRNSQPQRPTSQVSRRFRQWRACQGTLGVI